MSFPSIWGHLVISGARGACWDALIRNRFGSPEPAARHLAEPGGGHSATLQQTTTPRSGGQGAALLASGGGARRPLRGDQDEVLHVGDSGRCPGGPLGLLALRP